MMSFDAPIRGNTENYMINIRPSSLGLREASGVKRGLQKIKETAKRIFAIQRFTVVYIGLADRKRARSCINEVVGWTPFKKMEYIRSTDMDEYLAENSLRGKRVLFVNTLGTISSPAESIMEGSLASRIRRLALEDSTIRFCHYFNYDNYEDQTNNFADWIHNGHHYQPKKIPHMKYKGIARRQYAEYYRLVGKKFLNL